MDFYTALGLNNAFGAGVKSVHLKQKCPHRERTYTIEKQSQQIPIEICKECGSNQELLLVHVMEAMD